MGGYKIRIGDGSEIGPMDLPALKSWLSQGLVDGDSPVMRPGSRRWVPLRSVPELAGAVGAARRPVARPAGRRPTPARDAPLPRVEPSALDRGRVIGVGAILLAVAAGLGWLAWRPHEAQAAFDGTPWLELALAALAVGLAVLPGRNLGRRLARVALAVAAFAFFPVAGILVAQGERGPAIVALGCAWLLVSGLVALLAPGLRPLGLALGLLGVLAGGIGAVRFARAPESVEAGRVREWTAAERAWSDGALGLALEPPPGWVVLKPGNPVVAASADTPVTLAQPRRGGLAWLVAGPAPRGVATPDQYLDAIASRRRAERPGWRETGRENAVVGALAGRRALAAWSDADGVRQRELIVAGLDGWVAFALVAHLPEAAAERSGGLDALAASLAARGLLAVRLAQAIAAAVAAVPHQTRPAAEQLMAASEARVLDPEQAFRRSVAALAKRIPSFSKAQARELSELSSAVYASMPWAERGRLSAYIERVRRGDATSPDEDRAQAALVKSAEQRLSPARLLSLQAQYDRAILGQP